jgi:hypothetical protein
LLNCGASDKPIVECKLKQSPARRSRQQCPHLGRAFFMFEGRGSDRPLLRLFQFSPRPPTEAAWGGLFFLAVVLRLDLLLLLHDWLGPFSHAGRLRERRTPPET